MVHQHISNMSQTSTRIKWPIKVTRDICTLNKCNAPRATQLKWGTNCGEPFRTPTTTFSAISMNKPFMTRFLKKHSENLSTSIAAIYKCTIPSGWNNPQLQCDHHMLRQRTLDLSWVWSTGLDHGFKPKNNHCLRTIINKKMLSMGN